MDSKQKPLRRIKVKTITLVLLLIVAFAAAVFIGYSMMNQPKDDLDSVETVKERVGRLIILPTDEQPALATVVDKKKLTTEFLKQAEDGDKILIYQNAKKAIIYRPSVDRIVAVGPVDINSPEQAEGE